MSDNVAGWQPSLGSTTAWEIAKYNRGNRSALGVEWAQFADDWKLPGE